MMKPWLLSCSAVVCLASCESMLGPLPDGPDPFGNPFKEANARDVLGPVDTAEANTAKARLKSIVASPSPLVLFAANNGEPGYDKTVIAAGEGDPDAVSKVFQFSLRVNDFVETDQAQVLQGLHDVLGQVRFDRALSQEPGHVQVKVNTLMSAGNGQGMLDDDALPLEMPPTTLPNEPVDPLDVTPDLDTPELPSLSTPTSPTLPALDPPVVEDTVTPTIDDIPTSDLPPLEQALTPDDELPLEEDLRLENPTEGTTPGDINDLLNLEN